MNLSQFRQRGSILVLFAITLPLLFLFSGMAVDLGYVYVQRSHMQNSADAAALAGATKLNTSDTAAGEFAQIYLSQNSTAADSGQSVAITYPHEKDLKKIRVEITEDIPLFFFRYFGYNTMSLSVHAIASCASGSSGDIDIFSYSMISGGDSPFYLLGEWGSGSNHFNGPIHVNGKFQFDKNSESGHGTDNIPGSGNTITSPISISAAKYPIGGLDKPANQVLAKNFTYGTTKIDITENNPTIKAKIDALTNKANTFSDSHPANVWGSIDVGKLTTPLYVTGNFGSGNNAKNIVSGTYNNNVTIVATGDISLNFSAASFSSTATVTLISLTGNIFISGGNVVNLNALAPHGSITVNGGGTTLNGWILGQSITLGQGSRTYANGNWKGGASGSGKISLIE